MKTLKIISTTALFWLSVLAGWAQQDPLYSQYQFNQLMINPAYTGVYDRFSIGLMSRLQWAGIEGAPVTHTLTAQKSILDGKIGVGGLILQDKFGVNTNTELQATYSYNINFEEAKLAMGLQAGLINFSYDFSNLELDFVDDPSLNTDLDNFMKPNFGVGAMYITNKYFVGASVPRILDINVNDGALKSTRYMRHYYLTGGLAFEPAPYTLVRVMSLMRYVVDGRISTEFNVSTLIDEKVWGGLTVRDLKHYGIYMMLEATDNLRIGYSFEIPANSLIQSNYGTHEISVFFRTKRRNDSILDQNYF
ncbi:MAG: type IX secretion system membrane protein PorP/SprF [bacterium]|nr:type IX secretion system membrane protein PorP/SprF [bacterium]